MAQYQDNNTRRKGDTGDVVLAVQLATGASQVDADGNYTPLQTDASGNLRVNVAAGGTSGQQYADGAARGTATGTLAMGDDGTLIQSLSCDSSGFLNTNIAKISGNTAATAGSGILSVGIGASGNSVIGSLAANQSVNLAQVGGAATVTASAGIQRISSISSEESNTIFVGGLSKTPTFLQISASASGSNALVASAASTKYRILAYNLMANGAVNAQFLSSATPMGGMTYMPTAGVGKVAPYSPVGWMETTAGHTLNLNLSANIAVGGEIVYIAI